MLGFEVTHEDGGARRGVLTTPHGRVETPAFMPVGTAGSIKGVTPEQLRRTGVQMVLANTYHLQLRPTAEIVRDVGGIHRFMGWDGPILTDSGGYQVFSLASISRITDEGVEFRSHVDGTPLRLDPHIATRVQNELGADVIMTFDDCPALPCEEARLRAAVDRSVRWARRCKETHSRPGQAIFAVVQGGLNVALRRRCAEELTGIGFDGYAIGGLSVGETHEEMIGVLGPVVASLPVDCPRYLMGVGMPRDIVAAVKSGVDLFDCVLPTRNGRNGWAFTSAGLLKMRNSKHRRAPAPLEADCDCETCHRFSRSYIRHLFNVNEMLGPTLTSIHNLRFYQRFLARIRDLICEGRIETITGEFPIAVMEASTSSVEECT